MKRTDLTKAWLTLRYEALVKANGTCSVCIRHFKESGAFLCVDHILPLALHPDLAFDPSNLRVVCSKCLNLTQEK